MAYVRAAIELDAASLAPRLRRADREELKAASGKDPEVVLLASTVLGHAWTICDEADVPIGIFGVVGASNPTVGVVWMVATDDIELPQNALPFLRQCRQWVEVMNAMYPILWNCIDDRNVLHKKWLRWCGFDLRHRHERYGREGIPFIEFTRIREPCATQQA
jgi:hypothetical protein